MSIVFDPKSFISKIAPEKKIKKLLSGRVTVKKTALSFLDDATFEGSAVTIDKKSVVDVALKVAKNYRSRIDAANAEGAGADKFSELTDDPALLINRVQTEVIFQVHDTIKTNYAGQTATWLPSSADEPDPEHQLNYGKEYIIGEGINGEEPGDRYGCQCGVEIKTNDEQLNLE